MDQPPKSDLEKEPEVVEVSQFDVWKVIKPGTIGVTTGLGVCFGIVIYNPETKYAIVGHLVSPKDTTDLTDILEKAKKLSKSLGKMKAYVGGNTLESENAPDFKADYENRKFVENKLHESGFQTIKIKYANLIETTEMRIDTRTGEVEYIKHDDIEDVWSRQDEDEEK
ncbi:hypothetical protein HYW73_03065 [Candidatus Nomurabacteria bacterium]|nr:hypothetical protein [Candidatus Nomurabacteria bacterium]